MGHFYIVLIVSYHFDRETPLETRYGGSGIWSAIIGTDRDDLDGGHHTKKWLFFGILGLIFDPSETLDNKGITKTENIYGIDEIWEKRRERRVWIWFGFIRAFDWFRWT